MASALTVTYSHLEEGKQTSKFEEVTLAPVPDRVERHFVFLCDATGSMKPFFDLARGTIKKLLSSVSEEGAPSTAVSLVFFRDHRDAFTTHSVLPCSDATALVAHIDTLTAEGGGDEPEALAEALRAAVEMTKKVESATPAVVVLIGDAPPHGTLSLGRDDYPEGGPEGALVSLMAQCDALAEKGARLVCVVASEASRKANAYVHSVNTVFASLALRSSPNEDPMVFPLVARGKSADALTAVVAGAAAIEKEDLDLVEKIKKAQAKILEARPELAQDEDACDEAVAEELAQDGVTVTEVTMDGYSAYDKAVAQDAARASTLSEMKGLMAKMHSAALKRSRGHDGEYVERADEYLSPAVEYVELRKSRVTSKGVRKAVGKQARARR